MAMKKEGIVAIACLAIIFGSIFISALYQINPGQVPPVDDRILEDLGSGTVCSVNVSKCSDVQEYPTKTMYGLVVIDTLNKEYCLLSDYKISEKNKQRLWNFTGTCAEVKKESISIGYCYDSDKGKDIFVKGYAFAHTDSSTSQDSCKDSTTVLEQICENSFENYICPLGGCQTVAEEQEDIKGILCPTGYECKEGACSLIDAQDGTGEEEPEPETPTPEQQTPSEIEYTCLIDSDCTKVKSDCCDCAHSGKSIAINKSSEQAWLNSLSSRCSETACVQMVSTDWSCKDSTRAICVAGKCQLHEGTAATTKVCSFGTRKSGKYCGLDENSQEKYYNQLAEDAVCENNFECESNLCTSGKCVGTTFLQRIFDWFKALFSGEMSIQENIAPKYFNIEHSYVDSETPLNKVINFSSSWNDETSLATKGTYILSTNFTGSWENSTPIKFTTTPQKVNIFKTWKPENSPKVFYKWYASDNAGNWNVTPIKSFQIETSAVTSPKCGNGITEEIIGEECDDGNNVDTDECSNLCKKKIINPPILDTTAPTLLLTHLLGAGYNNTLADKATKFSITVEDDTTLYPNGQYIFSTNNSGSWINDSVQSFGANAAGSNPKTKTVETVKVLNSTIGMIVGFRWYAKDNASNWASSQVYSLTTTKLPSVCRDGKPEGIEECDDGNNVDTDECSNLCKINTVNPPENEVVASVSCTSMDSNTITLQYGYDAGKISSGKISIFRGDTKINTFSLTSPTFVDASDGTRVYKFLNTHPFRTLTNKPNNARCPVGFNLYQNWTETASYYEPAGWCAGCTTKNHTFANITQEYCEYDSGFFCNIRALSFAKITYVGCVASGKGGYVDTNLAASTQYTYYLRDGDASTSPLIAEVKCTTSNFVQETLPDESGYVCGDGFCDSNYEASCYDSTHFPCWADCGKCSDCQYEYNSEMNCIENCPDSTQKEMPGIYCFNPSLARDISQYCGNAICEPSEDPRGCPEDCF